MVCRPCKLPCGELHYKGYDVTTEAKPAKKLLTSSMPVIVDPSGDTMEPTTQRREFLTQAYENSLIYKERTKKLHDDKIKNIIFNVGDQVLLFNSTLKIFSDSSTIMEETHHRWRFRTLPLSLRTTEYRDRVEPTTRIIPRRLKISCVGYCPGQDL
nr:reverse transcriptase domain-containing protein [Tanacetum cinerariifolium]